MIKSKSDKDNRINGQDKIRAWALTPEAQAITPKASFLVYDFLTGRYENTLKNINDGKVTKADEKQDLALVSDYILGDADGDRMVSPADIVEFEKYLI